MSVFASAVVPEFVPALRCRRAERFFLPLHHVYGIACFTIASFACRIAERPRPTGRQAEQTQRVEHGAEKQQGARAFSKGIEAGWEQDLDMYAWIVGNAVQKIVHA